MLAASSFPGPSPAASAASDVADVGDAGGGRAVGDRSTTFQPVEGGTEHRSGETLLVSAYAGLWVLLLGWVAFQWTKQTALARRLDELESLVAKAADAQASKPTAAK
jgi:hypothetical protein